MWLYRLQAIVFAGRWDMFEIHCLHQREKPVQQGHCRHWCEVGLKQRGSQQFMQCWPVKYGNSTAQEGAYLMWETTFKTFVALELELEAPPSIRHLPYRQFTHRFCPTLQISTSLIQLKHWLILFRKGVVDGQATAPQTLFKDQILQAYCSFFSCPQLHGALLPPGQGSTGFPPTPTPSLPHSPCTP